MSRSGSDLAEALALGADEWSLVLMASVYEVIDTRDSMKLRKEQQMHLMMEPALEAQMERARAARSTLDRRVERLLAHADAYMPSEEAVECFAAARSSSQRAWASHGVAGDRCAFSGCASASVRRVTFHGNWCTASGERAESTHCVDVATAWRKWLEAAMVLGVVREWLDERAAAWIDVNDVRHIDAGVVSAVTCAEHLARKRCALASAARYFAHVLDNPPP